MAKLKAKIAKLEDVAEAAREFYVKGDDGAFYLDADGVDDMPAVIGLRKNRDELKSEKKRVEEKLAADTKALEEKIAELEKGNRGGKNDEKIAELETRIKSLQTSAAQEKAASDAALEKERGALRTAYKRTEIAKALAEHGGNPKFLMHLLENQVKVDLDGESYKVTVVDANGNARIKSTAEPTFLVKDLVAELKANAEYAGAFAATGATGSGAPGNSAPAIGPGGVKQISRKDPGAFAKNAADIAAGKAVLVD